MPYPQQKSKIETIEKQILGILMIIGIATLIFGFLYFKQSLISPFYSLTTDYNKKTNEQKQVEELLALKEKDSDGDGLTDYEEMYQYKTSRFLEDTDSDGLTDSEEIKNNTDPLCATGKTCNTISANTNSNSNINAAIVTTEDMTPAQLRELLLQSGVTQEQLDTLDDSELLQYYQATYSSILNSNNNTNNTNGSYSNLLVGNSNLNINATSTEDLQNLSAAEIRKLLIETGNVTEEDLKGFTDSDLQTMFTEYFTNTNTNK